MTPGLVIIDMQEECIETIGEKHFLRIIQPQLSTIDYFRRKRYPIILVEYRDMGSTAPQILDALPKEDGETFFKIEKNSDDLFKYDYPTAVVREMLKRTNTSDLGYAGLYAANCLRKSMIGSKIKKIANNFTSADLIAPPEKDSLEDAINRIRESKIPVFNNYVEMIAHLEARSAGAKIMAPRSTYLLS